MSKLDIGFAIWAAIGSAVWFGTFLVGAYLDGKKNKEFEFDNWVARAFFLSIFWPFIPLLPIFMLLYFCIVSPIEWLCKKLNQAGREAGKPPLNQHPTAKPIGFNQSEVPRHDNCPLCISVLKFVGEHPQARWQCKHGQNCYGSPQACDQCVSEFKAQVEYAPAPPQNWHRDYRYGAPSPFHAPWCKDSHTGDCLTETRYKKFHEAEVA